VDIDGTLVDSTYQHTLAWQRALSEVGAPVPAWTVHRHIGMGADQIVEALAGREVERRHGDMVRAREGELFMRAIDSVRPLPGAEDLLDALRATGDVIVLASSARVEEVEVYLDLLDGRRRAHAWTTSADVAATKPEPDLVRVALGKAGAGTGVMVGDTVWDCKAAAAAGLPTIALLSGGVGADELREAGALAVFASAAELAGDIGRRSCEHGGGVLERR
jgi:HAD superfamily hydrolase (TIGR01509 family)